MNTKVCGLVGLFCALLLAGCASNELPLTQWPKACDSTDDIGYVHVVISKKRNRITVDGMKYKPGIMKEHQVELSTKCKDVRVLISRPKGLEAERLFAMLAIEANEGPGEILSVVKD